VAARVFREERVLVLATLIRQVGDFQLAEDAMQDAFESALVSWPRDGVPRSPGAWINVTARRRAIDRLRRERATADRAARLAELVRLDEQAHPATSEATMIVDDRLRLIFTCCHPALDPSAQVALTLRTLGGLTTGEIARAFLVAEPTMGKRIARAKRKIADARIRYRVPDDDELPGRLRGVLRTVYLIFNEGYSASAGDRLTRGELCGEAIRLGRLLVELMPGEADAWGLLALMLLHDARRAARTVTGGYVALADQDRSLWDDAQIADGLRALEKAIRFHRPGEYQLQAAITALHIQAADPDATNWAQIAGLYAALGRLSPSAVVDVNHAAAVGFAEGPQAGLELLRPLLAEPALAQYQPLHAAHAELLSRAGDRPAATHAYQQAIALTQNAVTRAELQRRLAALTVK
ncbi:MAG TPA: sigma-70 family RNA polymerase sigma factor, partial [Streptosporangiaceae bacterium]|nr:sigma-70 family RNA polymerase sigma factor [Streptosporangiaceae bacterium]